MLRARAQRQYAKPTRRQLFAAVGGGAAATAVAAVPGLSSVPAGRSEDPGFFGEVTKKVDASSFMIRHHETGEELLIQAQTSAEIGRDGSARMADFEPGETITALGTRSAGTVSATAIFSVADGYDRVVVTDRKGSRLETTVGAMSVDSETLSVQSVGDRPDAEYGHADSIKPGSELWVMARRDPGSHSAKVRRFAIYSE